MENLHHIFHRLLSIWFHWAYSYVLRSEVVPPPKKNLFFHTLKVTIRLDAIKYFSLNMSKPMQYYNDSSGWYMFNSIIIKNLVWWRLIEFVHGRAVKVWINKMVSSFIITTHIFNLYWKKIVGRRYEIVTRFVLSVCTFTLN